MTNTRTNISQDLAPSSGVTMANKRKLSDLLAEEGLEKGTYSNARTTSDINPPIKLQRAAKAWEVRTHSDPPTTTQVPKQSAMAKAFAHVKHREQAKLLKAATQPVPTVDSLFFAIMPAELRLQIYADVLRQPFAVKLANKYEDTENRLDITIFRASKRLFAETRKEFFKHNTINAAAGCDFQATLNRHHADIRYLRLGPGGSAFEFQLQEGAKLFRNSSILKHTRLITIDCDSWPQEQYRTLRDLLHPILSQVPADEFRPEGVGRYVLSHPRREQEWRFEYPRLAKAWERLPKPSRRGDLTWSPSLDLPICNSIAECRGALLTHNAATLKHLLVRMNAHLRVRRRLDCVHGVIADLVAMAEAQLRDVRWKGWDLVLGHFRANLQVWLDGEKVLSMEEVAAKAPAPLLEMITELLAHNFKNNDERVMESLVRKMETAQLRARGWDVNE